jgi:tetratricopeptide (TPR) repeat protein
VKRSGAVLVLVTLTSCAPALREPPSIETLAAKPAPAMAPIPAGVDAVLHAADARWAARTDVPTVQEAEALYLQAAQADEHGDLALIGATRAKVWLADHEKDSRTRGALAVSAVQTAQWCTRRAPDDPACDYWLAIAVGIQAREVRQTAEDGLKTMVAALTRVIEKNPAYDHAGPERVMALVLVRAPGWPLGPGDPESALEHARKAVALDPDYPPNLMAVAEALAATKRKDEARSAWEKALASATERAAAGDPDAAGWIDDSRRALGS